MSRVKSSSRATPLIPDREHTPGVESNDVRDDSASEIKPPKRKQKRARKLDTPPTTLRKKHARGKQGALQGIIQMPIEVLNEVVCRVTPADLITLVWTNKFFRSMLLRRSAILVWRRAQDNVPGLPPCPTEMSEPQYAALVFSELCTLCGKRAKSNPDPWIRARLCPKCRDTKLGKTTTHIAEYRFVAVTRNTEMQKGRRRNRSARFILEEFDQAKQTRQEFLDKKDHKGLKEWEIKTLARLEIQRSEANELIKSINAREEQIETLKFVHRVMVTKRLKDLGWEDKYLDLSCSPDVRRWDTLVQVPNSLTDRVWGNLFPKLLLLLEKNKYRIDERDRQLRKAKREEKIIQLVQQLREIMCPFHDIRQALGRNAADFSSNYTNARISLPHPFPSAGVIANWEILADIRDGENTLEEVEELFNKVREELMQRVLKLREEAERKLVEQYMINGDGTKEVNSALTIKARTDAAKSLSPSTRFLLRADTIFVATSPVNSDKEHGQLARGSHFPAIVSRMVDTDVRYLERYVRHVEAERTAKALLKDLSMQGATYAELRWGNRAYACQRCSSLLSGTWEDLLFHYGSMLRLWSGDTFIHNKHITRHPIHFVHTHHLKPGPNAKPLARMLSSEEARKGLQSNRSPTQFWCLICSGVGCHEHAQFTSMNSLKEHLDGVHHGITQDLVHDLHYTDDSEIAWSQPSRIAAWREKWDAHADAKGGDNSSDEPGHRVQRI